MLTKQLRVYQWESRGGSISSDRLTDDCLPRLARAIAVYREKIGERLGRVRDAARSALEGLRPDRDESILVVRGIGIIDQKRPFISEHG